jgi:hypothetical protein
MGFKTFGIYELCKAGGLKYHIRDGNQTLCGRKNISNVSSNIIGVREDSEDICWNCIRKFQNKRYFAERTDSSSER